MFFRCFVFRTTLYLCLCFIFALTNSTISEAVIKKNKPNFYVLQNDGDVFFPFTVNASQLVKPENTNQQVKDSIASIAAAGANSIRFVIDDAFPAHVPLEQYEQFDGALRDELIDRIDLIIDEAGKYDLFCIPVFFDIQSMAINWDDHPHNKKNGGTCAQLMDFFTETNTLSRSLQRAKQIVKRYQGKNILAWEIARGPNVWEPVEGLNYKPIPDYIERVSFWIYRMTTEIRTTDEENHLIAVTAAPNTMPQSIMNNPYIDVNFLQIYSSKTPELLVKSIPDLIKASRLNKKPVFISELRMDVDQDKIEPMISSAFWSAIAASSGAFLDANQVNSQIGLLPDDQRRIETAQIFLNSVELDGVPRPAMKAPAKTIPSDSYLIAQSLVGNDWLFYIFRKNPGISKAKLEIYSVEGSYQFFWMDFENNQRLPFTDFRSTRKLILMESPEFYQGIIGRLRLKERFLPSDEKDKVDND